MPGKRRSRKKRRQPGDSRKPRKKQARLLNCRRKTTWIRQKHRAKRTSRQKKDPGRRVHPSLQKKKVPRSCPSRRLVKTQSSTNLVRSYQQPIRAQKKKNLNHCPWKMSPLNIPISPDRLMKVI